MTWIKDCLHEDEEPRLVLRHHDASKRVVELWRLDDTEEAIAASPGQAVRFYWPGDDDPPFEIAGLALHCYGAGAADVTAKVEKNLTRMKGRWVEEIAESLQEQIGDELDWRILR